MSGRRYIAIVALLAMLGLALAAFFYSGPFYEYDDMDYIVFAHQMLNGTFSMHTPRAYGLLMPLVLALSFKAFGYGTFQAELPSIVEYIAMALLAFLLGRKLFGSTEGLLAMLFVIIAPFIVQYATRAMPDMLIGMLTGMSLYALASAGYSSRRIQGRRNALFLLSGAFAALTIYAKLEGLAFVLFFALSLLVLSMYHVKAKGKRQPSALSISLSEFMYAMLGVAVAICLYMAISYAYTGSAIIALENYGAWQHAISPVGLSDNLANLYVTLFGYLYTGSGSILAAYQISPIIYPYGFSIVFSIIGTIFAIGDRKRNAAFLSLLSWPIFFYFFFGTMELSSYTFIAVITRYLSIIAIPLAVLAAYGLVGFHMKLESRIGRKAYAISAIFIAEIVLFSVPTFLMIHEYNSAIGSDTRVLTLAANVMRYHSLPVFSNNYEAAEYASIMSGSDYGVAPISACSGASSAYLLYFYNGSASANPGAINAPPQCNISMIENIGPKVAGSAYGVPVMGCAIYKAG
ncbi:MAG: glycosyltransferase family 39 protein [Candidatus Marsarchaeota archaeon]|jgi:4-amino-4-deoxy-L-arabinose transferase-like glycosyltransferase|nr:glycosyltransferase family 39 protein [Candidatus Marsarchaeota archaeon]MCL5418458.1 glycosyltransferase family 39 protein [Candidatus Marsarchaeota archaeon]